MFSHNCIKITLLKTILVMSSFLISLPSSKASESDSLKACDEKDSSVCASILLPRNIDFENPQTFQIKINSDFEIENLAITIWMPLCTTSKDGGMYSPPPTVIKMENDRYEVRDAYFMMPGAWEIIATFTAKEKMHKISFVFLL